MADAGWYRTPDGAHARYWDGLRWTNDVQPLPESLRVGGAGSRAPGETPATRDSAADRGGASPWAPTAGQSDTQGDGQDDAGTLGAATTQLPSTGEIASAGLEDTSAWAASGQDLGTGLGQEPAVEVAVPQVAEPVAVVAPVVDESLPAPGWYPDPEDPEAQRPRWWDGRAWSGAGGKEPGQVADGLQAAWDTTEAEVPAAAADAAAWAAEADVETGSDAEDEGGRGSRRDAKRDAKAAKAAQKEAERATKAAQKQAAKAGAGRGSPSGAGEAAPAPPTQMPPPPPTQMPPPPGAGGGTVLQATTSRTSRTDRASGSSRRIGRGGTSALAVLALILAGTGVMVVARDDAGATAPAACTAVSGAALEEALGEAVGGLALSPGRSLPPGPVPLAGVDAPDGGQDGMESRCRYDITRPAEQGRPLWVARGNDALTATVKAAAAEGTLSAIGVGDDSSLVVEAGGDGRPVGVLVQVGDKAAMVTFGDLPAASTTSVAQSRARAIALAGSIAGALSTS